jgi:hypothetical protein
MTRVRTGLLPGLLLVIGGPAAAATSPIGWSASAAPWRATTSYSPARTPSRPSGRSWNRSLGDATPVYEDEPGTWGLQEADQLVGDGGWSNPAGRERRPQ